MQITNFPEKVKYCFDRIKYGKSFLVLYQLQNGFVGITGNDKVRIMDLIALTSNVTL